MSAETSVINKRSSGRSRASMIVGVLMFVLMSVLAYWGSGIHEPWFDEAQAWVIARDNSLKDILFFIPHYEGHPPLWHLILKIPASLGMDFEFSIKLVQFITFEFAIVLLELCSPFRPMMKILLPANYFILYQYCIISRPYALYMASIFLTAMLYKSRKEKCFLYMFSLIFMCMCHSYGIAMAGGLIISDILQDYSESGKNIRSTIKVLTGNRKRFISYCILLATALVLIVSIMPRSDTFATNREDGLASYPRSFSFLLALFLIPSESIFTSFSEYTLMQLNDYSIPNMLTALLVSAVIWYLLAVLCTKRKKLLLLFVPYLCVSVLLALYTHVHHMGMFYIHVLFIFWVCDAEEHIHADDFSSAFLTKYTGNKMRSIVFGGTLVIAASINLLWTFSSYSADKEKTYYVGKKTYEWLKENDYLDDNIFTGAFDQNDYAYDGTAVVINAYDGGNVFSNMALDKAYLTHINPTKADSKNYYDDLKANGKPDVFVSCSGVSHLCYMLDIKDRYYVVYFEEGEQIFKGDRYRITVAVYLRDPKDYKTYDLFWLPY